MKTIQKLPIGVKINASILIIMGCVVFYYSLFYNYFAPLPVLGGLMVAGAAYGLSLLISVPAAIYGHIKIVKFINFVALLAFIGYSLYEMGGVYPDSIFILLYCYGALIIYFPYALLLDYLIKKHN